MSSTSSISSALASSASASTALDISTILASATGATTPGIDVSAAVAAAIYADRAPERAWAAEQTTLASQTTALTAIQTATTALATDMSAFNTLTGPLSTRTVTSSDAEMTASAATGTIAGSHSVDVISTAHTGAWYSDSASTAAIALPATSFTLTSGSGHATFTTGGSSGISSLNDLAAAINAKTAQLGVKATVVTDSTGARLAILSNTAGAAADFSVASTNYTGTAWSSPDIPSGGSLGANSITLSSGSTSATIATTSGESYATLAAAINATAGLNITATAVIDTNGTHLSLASTDTTTPFTVNQPAFGFTQAVAGADASLTVDGVPVSSATNTVTGAIPGVTLTLLGPTSAAANLTVASDTAGVATALNQFVTDYNTAVGLVNSQYQFNASTNSEGILAADPSVRSLQSALAGALNFVSSAATGGTAATTTPTLDSMGISVATDGTLSVNQTTLSAALTNNPADVQNFFQGASLNGFASKLTTALDTFTNPAHGAFTVDLKSIASTNTDLAKQTSDLEANYIAYQQTQLTAMYSQAEIALQALPSQMAQLSAELGNSKSGS